MSTARTTGAPAGRYGSARAADREAAGSAQAWGRAVQANRLARGADDRTGRQSSGTGIRPRHPQVAQREAPDSRIVYVDNDPIVLLHAQALLKSRGRARATTSRPTCTTRTRSWPGRPRRWTSASRWP